MTPQQRKSLHLYCEMLANALNDAGYDMRKVLEMRPQMSIPWTKTSVKENLFKPILLAMEEKDSTEDMDNIEPSEVYEVLNRFTAQAFGVSVPWPDRHGG